MMHKNEGYVTYDKYGNTYDDTGNTYVGSII